MVLICIMFMLFSTCTWGMFLTINQGTEALCVWHTSILDVAIITDMSIITTSPLSSVSLAKIYLGYAMWAQVEWWLGHRRAWLVKRHWVGQSLGWVTRDEYQVLGSTAIPVRLYGLDYWELYSWLTSVGTTQNTVIRLGWSQIGLAVLIRCGSYRF